ncbi:MAG: hypothetical protein ACRD0W_25380 [Acidimicrobiales bacterium]
MVTAIIAAEAVVVPAVGPDPNPLLVAFAENLLGVYTEGHHLVYQE